MERLRTITRVPEATRSKHPLAAPSTKPDLVRQRLYALRIGPRAWVSVDPLLVLVSIGCFATRFLLRPKTSLSFRKNPADLRRASGARPDQYGIRETSQEDETAEGNAQPTVEAPCGRQTVISATLATTPSKPGRPQKYHIWSPFSGSDGRARRRPGSLCGYRCASV